MLANGTSEASLTARTASGPAGPDTGEGDQGFPLPRREGAPGARDIREESGQDPQRLMSGLLGYGRSQALAGPGSVRPAIQRLSWILELRPSLLRILVT